MPRAMAHYPPCEMAVLGLVESTLSFAVIYTVVQATGASVPRTVVIEMPLDRAFATAALLTVIGGFVALIIGLYRPEVCLDRKRLLIASAFAAIIAFTLLLLVDNGPRSSLTSGHALYLAKVIATWLASITLVRLTYALAVNRMSLGRRVLLLGDPRQVGALSVRLRSYRGQTFDPVVLHGQSVSWQLLRQLPIWGIVVASEPQAQAVEPLVDCKLRGAPILSAAAFQENYLGRIDPDAVTANDLLLSQGFTANKLAAGLKRLCDVVSASACWSCCCR